MKKPLTTILMMILIMLLALTLAQRRPFLIIGTGGVTGVYYPVGGSVARIVNGVLNIGLRLTVESTPGSVFNVQTMNRGNLDLAVVQSDVVYQAYNGENAFKDSGIEKLRTVMGLHSEPMHLVCNTDAGVGSFRDIVGKRVNIGSEGSGQRNTIMAMLDVVGVSLEDFTVESAASAQAPDLLRDGQIDCFFYTVGIGAAAIQSVAFSVDINIVPLDDPELEDLAGEFPYYTFATIPAGTYRGVDEDITVFGVKAIFTTTTDLREDSVYKIVKGVLRNLPNFQNIHPALAELTCEDFLSNLGAPLHEGAKRAYEEFSECDLPEGM